ncbi:MULTISPECIES: Crp/Fnr family transcriptional regulator [Chryseobacterium]|uniref:CRP-like cAMP-binding protein n=1 Tax=Chryseobacterium camelliae TaxID=1265445 RepID=A0ABU0TKP4_9FLAO|nr:MULTISPECIES: Crp/Fnr family transcriptional regulator [Chryseobacterium]MDT3408529.1 CRP-like cAMP-binding protein [Pseudacidovorax intermedius]MDQ1097616.1 CRP-like cAMP-binding protein [Chryseobacterium camelliae]MDQ1101545.1 CRP-like cAMP-binding protein [Chryseobacterium sp. SORGH_AS_1048]MDR6084988.1 CRP-like cAMP-binding protein [Chryseobacterium sp. SORGH_AS_0909]MDR6129342.1 CRP-like cAMP-binding protein [Chryseobacterium sp. SORGH_AS_1175]
MVHSLLSAIENVVAITDSEKSLIAGLFRLKRFEAGDFFLREGEVCKQIGFIEKGLVRYFINDDGEEKIYSFSKENQFTSNYESFGPQKPSKQSIQVLEDSSIYVISFQDLEKFYAEVRNGERFGRIMMSEVFIETLQNLNSLYTDSPQTRYENFIRENADLQQRISQYYIASYVGVKPQSLSRIRKRISF